MPNANGHYQGCSCSGCMPRARGGGPRRSSAAPTRSAAPQDYRERIAQMAQLVLFTKNAEGGPREWVVIDTQDLGDEELEAEYGGELVERTELLRDMTSWPCDRELEES